MAFEGAADGPFEQHQVLRIAHRQRLEHDRVDDTEDGGVGADTEGQRQDSNGGEAGILRQHAQTIEHVAAPACQEGESAAFAQSAVFRVMLPGRHSRFLSSLRFLQLMGQRGPIDDVPARDLAGPLLACAQPQRLGVRVFQLAGHFFHDFRFALGAKAPQAQVLADILGPIKHGWAARSG